MRSAPAEPRALPARRGRRAASSRSTTRHARPRSNRCRCARTTASEDYLYDRRCRRARRCVQMGDDRVPRLGLDAPRRSSSPTAWSSISTPTRGSTSPTCARRRATCATLLQPAGLASFPLVTGGKGVHVVVPLTRTAEWDEVKDFADGFAPKLAEAPSPTASSPPWPRPSARAASSSTGCATSAAPPR